LLFGVVIPCAIIGFAWNPPEQLEGKQWFVVTIMMTVPVFRVWHRLENGEWFED